MTDVVIPNIIRVQSILHHPSGESTDRFVNTWHFHRLQSHTWLEAAPTAGQIVYDFFFTANGVNPKVANWIPREKISHVELRAYDLGQAPPRAPFIMTVTSDLTSLFPSHSNRLPEEVAVCLSYHAGIGPRRRGRVYIGPLSSTAMVQSSARTVIDGTLRGALGAAALRMRDQETGLTWGVLSRMDGGTFSPIFGGWIDNAFDTQRRRGLAPDHRHPWGEGVPSGSADLPLVG